MSDLPGVLGPHATTGTASTRVDVALSTRTPFVWTPNANKVSDLGTVSTVSAVASEPSSTGHTGDTYATLTDDWYERVHIVPTTINLGVISFEQARQVEVWNAWFSEITFTGVTGNDDSLVVSGLSVPPYSMPSLSSWQFNVTVKAVGPQSINNTISWLFTGKPSATLILTGTRLIPWIIPPQWANNVVETFGWKTDVKLMKSGVEQRRQLVSNPRRTWEFSFLAQKDYRRWSESALFGWSLNTWLMPVWTDAQYLNGPVSSGTNFILCTTADLDFIAGNMALLTSTPMKYEVVPIDSVETDRLILSKPTSKAWGVGTKLIPLRRAILNQDLTISRITTDAIEGRVQFLSIEDEAFEALDPATLPQYRGYPVLVDRPEYTEEPQVSVLRTYDRMDFDIGTIRLMPITDVVSQNRTFVWMAGTKAERTRLKKLYYFLKGQQKALWTPSMNDDVVLLQSIAAVDTTIAVENLGYTAFLKDMIGRKDLRIETVSGTIYTRRVVDSVEVSEEQENLTLDSALGAALDPEDVLQISFMTYSRLAGDMIEIDYDTDSQFKITATFKGVGDDI